MGGTNFSTGEIATCDIFRSGVQILLIESEGQIQAMKKADKSKDQTHSKVASHDNPAKK